MNSRRLQHHARQSAMLWALAGGALERGDIAAAECLRAKAATYYEPGPMQKVYDARLRSMLAVYKQDQAGSVRFAEVAAAAD